MCGTVERGLQHVGLMLNAVEHVVDGGGELIELVLCALHWQSLCEIAIHDGCARSCDTGDAPPDSSAVENPEESRKYDARSDAPEHCVAQTPCEPAALENVCAYEQPASAWKPKHLCANGMRDHAASFACIDLELDGIPAHGQFV